MFTLPSQPLEVHVVILSYLAFNDIVRCRRVCKSLKKSVEYFLKQVVYLTDEMDIDPVPYDKDIKSIWYFREQYMDKDLLSKYSPKFYCFPIYSCNSFFSLVARFCPKLQVLTITRSSLTFRGQFKYNDLLQIAPSIEYLKLEVFPHIPQELQKSPESIFTPFKNLKVLNTQLCQFWDDNWTGLDVMESFALHLNKKNEQIPP